MKGWEQAVYDFNCMRRGKTMEWIVDDKGIHLFIDEYEINIDE